MGVPRLFPWINKRFPNEVKHFQEGTWTTEVDNLYFDANGILHTCAQRVFNYGQQKRYLDFYSGLSDEEKRNKVYQCFFERILEMTRVVKPKKVLYIAIDGPAPLSKQAQQRQRRFVAAKGRSSGQFDSNQISPGTLFMYELSRYAGYAIRHMMHQEDSLKNVKVYFSPPNVPGEGEHKCLDYIRSLPLTQQNNESHCIVGLDGDLIMLTLAMHLKRVYLFREDQYKAGYMHFLNMSKIGEKMGEVIGLEKRKRVSDVENDFILMGFFVGNDFLPRIRMFYMLDDGLGFMVDSYKKISKNGSINPITVDGHVSLKGFSKFIQELSKYEKEYILEQIAKEIPEKEDGEPDTRFENVTIKNNMDVGGRFNFKGYQKDYYSKLFSGEKFDQTRIDGVCADYLRSIIWVIEYYVHGLPSWKIAYKWHYAPLMTDFSSYLSKLNQEEFKKLSKFSLENSSKPIEQLLSILPPKSKDLVPEEYQSLMTSNKSPLVKLGYYPDEFMVDYEGKHREHEGIAILPFVEYSDVHKEYLKIRQKYKRKRNDIGKVSLFKYHQKGYLVRYNSSFGSIKCLRVEKTEEEPQRV